MSRIIRRQGLIIIHIVLTLLALSGCASSTPAAAEPPEAVSPGVQKPQAATISSLRPVDSDACAVLGTAPEQQLAAPILQANAPFSDPIMGQSGTACRLTAKCPADQPISACEVAPEQQIFDISLSLAQ